MKLAQLVEFQSLKIQLNSMELDWNDLIEDVRPTEWIIITLSDLKLKFY